MNATAIAKPMTALGQFFLLSAEALAAAVRGPWAWREILEQIWFVARVSIFPTIMLSIPYTVLIVFVLNILLVEIGAGDLSGAGPGWRRSPKWGRSSRRWSFRAPDRPPCAPTWARAPSAKKSMR